MAESAIARARSFLIECADPETPAEERTEAVEAARSAFGDARRSEAPLEELRQVFQLFVTTTSRDADPAVRIVAPAVVEDVCVRHLSLFVREATDVLVLSLRDRDPNVRTRAVRATTTIFRRTMGLVFASGVGDLPSNIEGDASLNGPAERFSLDWYQNWVKLHLTVLECMSDPHDGLANAAVKFADPLILALSYSGTGVAGSQDHFTLDFAHANAKRSPSVDVPALQAYGKSAVVALSSYVHHSLANEMGSGVRSIPFMTALMVLGNLARRRKLLIDLVLPPLVEAAKALVAVESVSTSVAAMTKGQRASAVMVLRLSLQSLRSFSHARVGPITSRLASMCEELSAYEAREYTETLRKRHGERLENQSTVGTNSSQSKLGPSTHLQGLANMPTVNASQSKYLQKPEPQSRVQRQSDLTSNPQMPSPMFNKRPRADSPSSRAESGRDHVTPELASERARMLMRATPPDALVNFIMRKLSEGPGEPLAGEPSVKRSRTMSDSTAPSSGPVDATIGSAIDGAKCVGTAAAPGTRRMAAQRKHIPPIVGLKLDAAGRNRLLQRQCRRILQSEQRARACGAGPLRILALARLLTSATADSVENRYSFAEEVIDFIVKDLPYRIELALAWLHAEASNSVANDFRCANVVSQVKAEESAFLSVGPATMAKSLSQSGDEGGGRASRPAMNDGAKGSECTLQPKAESGNEDIPDAFGSHYSVTADPQLTVDASNERNATIREVPVDGIASCGDEGRVSKDDNRETSMVDAKHASSGSDRSEASVAPLSTNLADGEHSLKVVKIDERGSGRRHTVLNDEEDGETSEQTGAITGVYELGSRYEHLLMAMLGAASKTLHSDDRNFSRLIVEAPVIPRAVLDLVMTDCRDAARSRLGLSTLRDVISERPGEDRDRCLAILLQFTVDSDAIVRGPAIRLVVSKVFEEMSGSVPEAVEIFAIKSFQGAVEQLSTKREQATDGVLCSDAVAHSVEEEKDVAQLERHVWLFTALCAKKPSLIQHFAQNYVNASKMKVRATIIECAKDVAAQLGPECDSLLALVRGDSKPYLEIGDGVDDLVLGVTSASMGKTGSSLAPTCLVEAVQARYERIHDARLLYAVLTGLSRVQLVQYLPVLVTVDGGDTGASFKTMMKQVASARPQVIDPSDLLVELHKLPCTPVVSAALKTCFELKGIFRQDIVASALLKLLERDELPDLLMRTILLARLLYPKLELFIRDTVVMGVQGVIRKRVWEYPMLWKGFVQYCCALDDKSLTFLVRLPNDQLREIVSSQEELRTTVEEVLKDKSMRINRRDRKYLSATLENCVA